ncbi:nucleotidyltransferase family protein [Caenimonas koreensis]|uniref:nucleotidyltransferase family protein n=1 Tax=Caenimonas koreensis TaxID=367474 RepID=UPI003784D269
MQQRFIADVRTNPVNRAILDRWEQLALPDGWLVAGCLFQTVWNLHDGAAPQAQIKDYDLFYFDAADLSEQAEMRVQSHVDGVLRDLGVVVEAKNQARVHLWYPEYFGFDYPQLKNSCDGIDRYLVLSTCVGVRPHGADFETYAPYGLDILYDGVLSPNPLTDHRELFLAKARSYQQRWPWLRIDG